MGYFVWTLACRGAETLFMPLLRAQAEVTGAEARICATRRGVEVAVREGESAAASYFTSLESLLPASLFLRGASHRTLASYDPSCETMVDVPRYSAPCPACQKEMFDVASRRYYYPFTSCNACGAQAPFVEHYPFVREHTSMRFFVPCDACREELRANPFRKGYPLISCVDCGITMKMEDGKSERFANAKGEFRTLFEVAARAIAKGKRVLVKTLFGYRLFFLPEAHSVGSETRLMVGDTEVFNRLFVLVPEEFHALLSIERPLVRVAIREPALTSLFGSSVWCKFADDGISMLLARELLNAGYAYAAYEEADETEEADYRVEFDVPIRFARDIRLFVNRERQILIDGTRGIYPRYISRPTRRLCIVPPLAAIPWKNGVLIDDMERLEACETDEVYVSEEAYMDNNTHDGRKSFKVRHAALMSVLAEHDTFHLPAIGIHFERALHIGYYNGLEVKDIIVPKPFDARHFLERLPKLRDGAERLYVRFSERFASRYDRLAQGGIDDVFTAAAVVMGLEGDIDALHTASLAFLGKGGVQVDTYVRDNAMDDTAFLASLMSYVLADADRAMLAYSIFESLGDFIGEAVAHIAEKTGTNRIVCTGETLANQALYGRLVRNLGRYEMLWNETLPMGRDNAIVGANYLV